MVPRGTYRACIHVSCVFVFLLFPASSAEKLGKTSLHCQVLHGHNQKSLVSPVWRRKCWIRNLECFCGRALSKCRNKSLAADPNPWSLFMEEGRDCSSTFVSLVEPGQGENRHSIQCGASEVVTEPCSSVPQLVWQREQLGALTVSCLGCEREICNFMAGWLSHQPWGDGKKVRWQQQQALPDRIFGVDVEQTRQMILNCHCSVCDDGSWGVGQLSYVQIMTVYKWRVQSLSLISVTKLTERR